MKSKLILQRGNKEGNGFAQQEHDLPVSVCIETLSFYYRRQNLYKRQNLVKSGGDLFTVIYS